MRTRNTIQRIWIIIIMSFVGIYTYGQDTIQVLQKSCKYTFVIPEGWDTIPRSVLMQKLPGYSIDAGLYPLQQQEYFKGNYILINFLPTIKTLNGFPFKQIEEDLVKMNEKSLLPVSIRPRACFFPLFSFLPLWLHYNLNPLCVQY